MPFDEAAAFEPVARANDPFLLPDALPTDADRAIAEHVGPLVPDGATLQTGIGGIPSTVVGLLASGAAGDYGIHSEMFTTGLMQLPMFP